MAEIHADEIRLSEGVWQLKLQGAPKEKQPEIVAMLEGRVLPDLRLEWLEDIDAWGVSLKVPPEMLSDGVSVIMLTNKADGQLIATLPLLAGSLFSVDERAELARLSAEIELLKSVIRAQFRDGQNAFLNYLPQDTILVRKDELHVQGEASPSSSGS